MSNEKTTPPSNYHLIDAEELDRFFAAVGVSVVCPCCGKRKWVVIPPPENEVFITPSVPHEGNVINGSSNVPLIAVACENCFLVRFHAGIPLAAWLRDNPAK